MGEKKERTSGLVNPRGDDRCENSSRAPRCLWLRITTSYSANGAKSIRSRDDNCVSGKAIVAARLRVVFMIVIKLYTSVYTWKLCVVSEDGYIFEENKDRVFFFIGIPYINKWVKQCFFCVK